MRRWNGAEWLLALVGVRGHDDRTMPIRLVDTHNSNWLLWVAVRFCVGRFNAFVFHFGMVSAWFMNTKTFVGKLRKTTFTLLVDMNKGKR